MRNLVGVSLEHEYTGDIIPESAVAECLSQAESLRAVALDWLKKHKPDLL